MNEMSASLRPPREGRTGEVREPVHRGVREPSQDLLAHPALDDDVRDVGYVRLELRGTNERCGRGEGGERRFRRRGGWAHGRSGGWGRGAGRSAGRADASDARARTVFAGTRFTLSFMAPRPEPPDPTPRTARASRFVNATLPNRGRSRSVSFVPAQLRVFRPPSTARARVVSALLRHSTLSRGAPAVASDHPPPRRRPRPRLVLALPRELRTPHRLPAQPPPPDASKRTPYPSRRFRGAARPVPSRGPLPRVRSHLLLQREHLLRGDVCETQPHVRQREDRA